jgi:3-oxoacyl-[acyl-carrier protein] reductase
VSTDAASPPLASLGRSIRDRVAIVTGAASGIGRATARLFAQEGARVAALDRDAVGAARVGDEIRAAGGTARGFGVDVSDGARIATVVAEARAAFGPIDILVNNAGVVLAAPIGAADFEAAWDATLAVNLTAHTRTVRACLDDLRRRREGRIVNIASTEGLGATAFISAYTASKHGVIGLTRALAVELGAAGVTVNAVCPGPIRTGMTSGIPDDAKATFAKRRTALGRYGEPEEIAHMVLSLALPAASFVTGAVLVVDGGLTIRNA